MAIKSSDNFEVGLGTSSSAVAKYVDQVDISDIQQSQHTREDIFSQSSGAVARSRTLIVSNAYTEGGTLNSYATPELVLLILRNVIGAAKAGPAVLNTPTRYSYAYNFTGTFTKRLMYLWMKQNEGQLKKHTGSFTECSFAVEPDSTVKVTGTWSSESIADDTTTFTPAYTAEDYPFTLRSSVTLQAYDGSGSLTGSATDIDFSSCTLNIVNNLTGVSTSDGRKLRNGLLDVSLDISKDQLNDTYFDAGESQTAYQAVISIGGNDTKYSTVIKVPVMIGDYTEDRTRGEDIAETIPFVFAPDMMSGTNKIEVVTVASGNNL